MKEEPIRIGLVGCGGRGTGAAENCLQSAPGIQLVALADMFPDRLESCRSYLAGLNHPGYQVDPKRCFTGFDAFVKLIDCGVDLVLLATPPGFRPQHFELAVEAGKHVFMEKPIAVDPTGVRRVIATGERAKAKGLSVVSGTQYRHQESFVETIRRVHEGAIGEIRSARAYYNVGNAWRHDRKPEESDMEYQLRNWYYFDWLGGDHIVEQHIHTIDVTDWTIGARPIRAVGTGGRTVRTDERYGNIFDHFAIDYEYPNGVHALSMCRQWEGTDMKVDAFFVGTKGVAMPYRGEIRGENAWKYPGKATIETAYVQEHTDLVASIRAGAAVNESRQVAESTLTAIMGRQAAYTGRSITWEEMKGSLIDYSPDRYAFGPMPLRPAPMPGKYVTG